MVAMSIEGWATHLRAIGRAPGTVRVRTHYVQRLVSDLGCEPWEVTRDHVEGWLASHDWAPSTRRCAITSLTEFYAWAAARGIVDVSPMVGIASPRVPRTPPRPMPDDVLADAMNRASGELWWLLRILSVTGLRRGEVARLHSDDLEGSWLRVKGKGGRVRRVPVPADVAEHIRQAHGWVFPGRYGGHVPADTITQRVHDHTGYGPHTLRHRFATRIYAETGDVLAVQQLLGHASLATTQVYLGLGDDALILAASAAWAA